MPKKLSKRPAKKLPKVPPEKLTINVSEFFNPPKPDPFPELLEQMVVYRYAPGRDFTCSAKAQKVKLEDWGRDNGVMVVARIQDDGSVHASSRSLTDSEAAARKKRADKARHKDTADQAVAG